MAALLASACFNPDLLGTRCSVDGDCPDGLVCSNDVCRRTGDTGDADSGNGNGGSVADAADPDAANDPDSGGGDADADAAAVEGDQYLMGISLPGTPLGDALVRVIATVDVSDDETSASFSLQPVISPDCPAQGESGSPTGDPLTTPGPIAIEGGTFTLEFNDILIADGWLGVGGGEVGCTFGSEATLIVEGDVVETGYCGLVTAVTTLGTFDGTLGSLPIEEGTPGPELPVPPELPIACP